MALERINPFDKEDRFCLDHLLRYHWASELTVGKNVVDAACGTGFGSELLARTGATHVMGIDLSDEAVNECRSNWSLPNLSFQKGSLDQLPALVETPCGCVVCFETLEHVEQPATSLAAIKQVLEPGGLLVGSVPGEMDRLEDNEYHLHCFSRDKLQSLLGAGFEHVVILRQDFQLCSSIGSLDGDGDKPLARTSGSLLTMDFGKSGAWADSYVFLASDSAIPSLPDLTRALSRNAWIDHFEDALRAYRKLESTSNDYMRFYGLYNSLFAENGDLQRRFENLLHWGQYHYEKATGEEPEAHYLDSIEKAQSRREKELHQQVLELQKQVESLKQQDL